MRSLCLFSISLQLYLFWCQLYVRYILRPFPGNSWFFIFSPAFMTSLKIKFFIALHLFLGRRGRWFGALFVYLTQEFNSLLWRSFSWGLGSSWPLPYEVYDFQVTDFRMSLSFERSLNLQLLISDEFFPLFFKFSCFWWCGCFWGLRISALKKGLFQFSKHLWLEFADFLWM